MKKQLIAALAVSLLAASACDKPQEAEAEPVAEAEVADVETAEPVADAEAIDEESLDEADKTESS